MQASNATPSTATTPAAVTLLRLAVIYAAAALCLVLLLGEDTPGSPLSHLLAAKAAGIALAYMTWRTARRWSRTDERLRRHLAPGKGGCR